MTTLEGIDVSDYQGVVDWRQVRNSGKRFAFIKASEGTYYRDPQFADNWFHARERGLVRGAYHYFRPGENATDQVDYLHKYVHDNGHFVPGDFVAVDVETTDGLPTEELLNALVTFVSDARTETGRNVVLYTYPDFWLRTLGDPTNDTLAQCPLWLADYGPTVPHLANWPGGLSFWQYSSSGHCPGVGTAVDLDRFYGSINDLHKLSHPPA